MAEPIPIRLVPKDIEPRDLGEVRNITGETFEHEYDGKKVVIPKGKTLEAAMPIAHHMARHMAISIVRAKHEIAKEAILKEFGEDSKKYQQTLVAAIPMYEKKIDDEMNEILTKRESIRDSIKIKDAPEIPKREGFARDNVVVDKDPTKVENQDKVANDAPE